MEWQCVGCGAEDCNCELHPAQEQAILDQRLTARYSAGVRYTFTVTVEGIENAATSELYQGAKLMRKFGVATGQSVYPTPTGSFQIVDMQLNPWWRPPDSDWAKGLDPIPPGPGNPLGTRWMGLDAPGVGIHGTPDDASIGYSASHGCIRMHIPDAEWLFQHVKLGTPVVITDA